MYVGFHFMAPSCTHHVAGVHESTRHMLLTNDVIIITSSFFYDQSSSEQYPIHVITHFRRRAGL